MAGKGGIMSEVEVVSVIKDADSEGRPRIKVESRVLHKTYVFQKISGGQLSIISSGSTDKQYNHGGYDEPPNELKIRATRQAAAIIHEWERSLRQLNLF